jgi:hypothetical protein
MPPYLHLQGEVARSRGNSHHSKELCFMARVTIEDCIDKLPNRFELVLLAAHRARLVSQGAPADGGP